MVVYMINSDCVLAAGYVDPTRQIIHGKKLPLDHVCVLLTTAQQNIKAPFLAGDEEENSFLEKGKFFAFPKKFLYLANLQNKSLHLTPYSNKN